MDSTFFQASYQLTAYLEVMADYTLHEQYSIYGKMRKASHGQISVASMKGESKNNIVLWECILYADKINFPLFVVVDSVMHFAHIFGEIFLFLGKAFHK